MTFGAVRWFPAFRLVFGPMNGCQIRAYQVSPVGLQPIGNNGLEFASPHSFAVFATRRSG